MRNIIYQASVEAIDNNHDTIDMEDFVFAAELTSGDKLSTWINPFLDDVEVTKEMLRPPPKDIGWEDYYLSDNASRAIRKYKKRPNMFE